MARPIKNQKPLVSNTNHAFFQNIHSYFFKIVEAHKSEHINALSILITIFMSWPKSNDEINFANNFKKNSEAFLTRTGGHVSFSKRKMSGS